MIKFILKILGVVFVARWVCHKLGCCSGDTCDEKPKKNPRVKKEPQ